MTTNVTTAPPTADGPAAADTYEWKVMNGAWWLVAPNGALKTGWHFDTDYNGWFYLNGETGMQVGWQLVNGVWYYLNPVSNGTLGLMYANRLTPDGYYVNADGAWDGRPSIY